MHMMMSRVFLAYLVPQGIPVILGSPESLANLDLPVWTDLEEFEEKKETTDCQESLAPQEIQVSMVNQVFLVYLDFRHTKLFKDCQEYPVSLLILAPTLVSLI